jgi:hypothetical protein
MKSFFALIFWATIGILSLSAQTISFGINMPGNHFRVVNDTDDARLKIMIGDKMMRGNYARGSFAHRFFPMGYYGEVPLVTYACSATPAVHAFVYPPAWTMGLPTNALDDVYLASNPPESKLKGRVAAIKRSLHDQLGRKEKIAELDDWFRQVKALGIQYDGTGCEGMRMINAKSTVWIDYSGYTRTIMMVVRGNQKDGYRVDGPIYVNN